MLTEVVKSAMVEGIGEDILMARQLSVHVLKGTIGLDGDLQ